MPDAFIFDHVRTPRGRGKPDGALHEITPIQLAAQTLAALRDRNHLDSSLVDDVVLGCVAPIGEQGSDIARVAALVANYAETVAGQQLNRFCASGLEAVNNASAQVMSGQSDAVVGGGVESMSRVPMGSDGGAWYSDPAVTFATYYVPQGIGADLIATLDGYSRGDVDAFAAESQRRADTAWRDGRFGRSVIPVRDSIGDIALARDEHMRPETTVQSLSSLKPSFSGPGEQGGFDTVAQLRYPQVERIHHVHTAGNSSGIVDGAAAVLVGSRKFARKAGLMPRARTCFHFPRQRAGDHAHRPGASHREAPEACWHGNRRHRSFRGQRSLRLGGAALHAQLRSASRESERERWSYCHGPPARRDRGNDSGHCA